MNRRGVGWLSLTLGIGLVAAVVWPLPSRHEGGWMVTVGTDDPQLIGVGGRITPLRLILEGIDPLSTALLTRLILAPTLGLGTALSGFWWWQKRPTGRQIGIG